MLFLYMAARLFAIFELHLVSITYYWNFISKVLFPVSNLVRVAIGKWRNLALFQAVALLLEATPTSKATTYFPDSRKSFTHEKQIVV